MDMFSVSLKADISNILLTLYVPITLLRTLAACSSLFVFSEQDRYFSKEVVETKTGLKAEQIVDVQLPGS